MGRIFILFVQFCIIHNDVLCVASIADDNEMMISTQELATRYFGA